MKTYIPKEEEIERKWYLVDAHGEILGRLASKIAHILCGKHKPIYTPHLDTGDFVVVINAKKVKVTGRKEKDKIYYRHTGYPGGIKRRPFKEMVNDRPEEVIAKAVKGMLPQNKLGKKMLKKLKIYPDASHPHQAQKPQSIDI